MFEINVISILQNLTQRKYRIKTVFTNLLEKRFIAFGYLMN